MVAQLRIHQMVGPAVYHSTGHPMERTRVELHRG